MDDYFNFSVQPIPKDKINEYRELSKRITEVYRDHGASDYREFILEDDRTVGLPFPIMARANDDEAVIIITATFPSKEARDQAHKLIEADPRAAEIMDSNHPYLDYPRIAFGGFTGL